MDFKKELQSIKDKMVLSSSYTINKSQQDVLNHNSFSEDDSFYGPIVRISPSGLANKLYEEANGDYSLFIGLMDRYHMILTGNKKEFICMDPRSDFYMQYCDNPYNYTSTVLTNRSYRIPDEDELDERANSEGMIYLCDGIYVHQDECWF